MSVRRFDPEYWMQHLPELPGSGIAAGYGDSVQVKNASGESVPVIIDHAKYFQFKVDNLDRVQQLPDVVDSIMLYVYLKMREVAGDAKIIVLEELEAYHSESGEGDFVKGRFAYG